MKILSTIGGVLVVFALIIWGISSFLAPDDIAKCGASPSQKSGCGPVSAIVAISGGDTSARTAEAIRLYQAGWANTIIFSGAAVDKSGPSNALVMKQQAIDAGINATNILIEEQSETTKENASETKSIFDQYGIKSAILVTSAYHQRRAGLEFRSANPGVTVLNHPVASDKHWGSFWWLTPNGWALAIPEVVRSLILSTGGVDSR